METVLDKKVWTEQDLLAIEHPGHTISVNLSKERLS